MSIILATTVINAPIELCFRTSLSIDVEAAAEPQQKLRAISGVTSGIIGPDETVTWRMRQYGLWITHTTLISAHQPPTYFQDRMLRGLFDSFVHDHFFRALSPTLTEMRDELRFCMPLYLGGPIADLLLVKHRLATMLAKRNATIKYVLESREQQARDAYS
jgi:ligand-binding SRPBCC domain-containing protein